MLHPGTSTPSSSLRLSARSVLSLLAMSALASILAATTAVAAEAQQEAPAIPKSVKKCLKCHEGTEDTMTLGDGTEMSVAVDGKAFMASVHGKRLDCLDCHQSYDDDHGPSREYASRREYTLASRELCKRCHFDTYSRTLENVHYEYLKEGRDDVPACSDCHGAHAIHDPHQKRAMISESCGRCHEEVYATYRQSVHGSALSEDNPDVPACADCHTAHRIQSPEPSGFHLASPQICVRCHGDEEMMKRYDLPTTVASTYLADFHGVTASLAGNRSAPGDRVVVVCVDCHDYHAIQRVGPQDVEPMRKRAAEACVKCHEGAPVGFPEAWLSHYPPSLKHAPIVFGVQVMYRILIPVMVLGLTLQVGLHFYRVGLKRRS